jgi:gluconokinase
MIGTSGAVRVVSTTPRADARQRTWCYNLTDDYWVLGGAINNGGIALQWFRDKFAAAELETARHLGRDIYDLLGDYAAEVPPGSEGLILLPYYTGERAPHWNANARGVLFGLNLTHDKRHMVRATLEGVTYRMFSIFSALEEVAGDVREIRASGSFTRSSLWLQIMADVFGRTISVPGEPQGSAFGAFILGMSALGLLPSIKAVDNYSFITARFEPDAAHTAVYRELFAIYQRVYWNLQEEFAAISDLQRKLKESGVK